MDKDNEQLYKCPMGCTVDFNNCQSCVSEFVCFYGEFSTEKDFEKIERSGLDGNA